MKKFSLFLLLSIIISSCTEVIFRDPQPLGVKALKEIPNELQGKFSFVILNEETVMEIGKNYISGDDGKAYLSDSVIIKKLGDRYVVNKLVTEGDAKKGNWETYILQDKGCGFVKATTFIINSETYVEPFIAETNGTKIGQGQEVSIIVKPTADEFNAMLANDSITVSIILERVK